MGEKSLSLTQKAQMKRMALIMQPMVKRSKLLQKKIDALQEEKNGLELVLESQYNALATFLKNDRDLIKEANNYMDSMIVDTIGQRVLNWLTPQDVCPNHEECYPMDPEECLTKEEVEQSNTEEK